MQQERALALVEPRLPALVEVALVELERGLSAPVTVTDSLTLRLERERKARLRRKKEALDKKAGGGTDASKKAAIDAAMRRVAAKKAARQAEAPTSGSE